MNKICIFSLIISLAFALKGNRWVEEIYDPHFLPSYSLTKVSDYLNFELSSKGISDIKFISTKHQINQLDQYISFSYLQYNTLMRGMVHTVYTHYGEIQVTEIKLQDEESLNQFGYQKNSTLSFSLDYYGDNAAVLYQIKTELEDHLEDSEAIFFHFIGIEYQEMSQYSKFNVIFYALNQESEIEISACVAQVDHSQNEVTITDLKIKSEPYHDLMNQLRFELFKSQIFNVKHTYSRAQGLGFGVVIKFTYLHNNIQKSGEVFAHDHYFSERREILEIRLQSEESEDDHLWMNQPIPNHHNLEDYPNSSLFMIKNELEKRLADLKVWFIRFVDIKTKVINENEFKIKFYALSYDGELEIGTCFAYVIYQEHFIEIIDFKLQVYESAFKLSNNHQLGSWETSSYQPPKRLEPIFSSALFADIAPDTCFFTLEQHGVENIYLTKISTKEIQNIFGNMYKYHFISRNSNGREVQSGQCVFAVIDYNGWEEQHFLVKIVELSTISSEQK